MVGKTNNTGVNTLVKEGPVKREGVRRGKEGGGGEEKNKRGRGVVDDVGQRFDQLLSQSPLQRSQSPKQLDNFDQHPVVTGRSQETEEQGSQTQIILGIFSSQFANDIHGRRDHHHVL